MGTIRIQRIAEPDSTYGVLADRAYVDLTVDEAVRLVRTYGLKVRGYYPTDGLEGAATPGAREAYRGTLHGFALADELAILTALSTA